MSFAEAMVMPAFRTSPGLRQWHNRFNFRSEECQQFSSTLCTMMNGMSLQFNLPCANRYICAIACIWLSSKHCEDCRAYRFEIARPMACFSAYRITCAARTNTSALQALGKVCNISVPESELCWPYWTEGEPSVGVSERCHLI